MRGALPAFKKRIAWCCLAAAGILALTVIGLFWQRRGYQVDYGLESYADIMNSWTYADGSPADFSSLQQEADETIVYFQIPEMQETTTLSYRSHNVYTKVFLENELIYEADNTYSDMLPGSRWNLITLQPEQAGQMLWLQITAANSGGSLTVDHVYWGDRAAIVLSIIQHKMWAVLISMAICICGLFMIILDIALNYGKKRKDHGIRCLGAFALCIGVWSLTETNVLQLLVGDTQIVQSIDNLCLILSMMPMTLYADWTYGIMKYRFVRWFCILQILYLLACIVLPVAGLVHWYDLLPVARVFFGICAAGFLVLSIWMNRFLFMRRERRSYAAYLQLAGSVALSAAAVLELLRYGTTGDMDKARVLRIGLLFFIICFAFSSLFQAYKLIAQGMEYDSVHKLAYSDALTQLGNRVAYLEKLEECVKEHTPKLGIVYLDINNLKKVNDVHGHEEGDILIRTAANVIRRSFASYGGVYRIGGDEFCVLLDQEPEKEYAQAMVKFQNQIKEVNESGKYIFQLQIAQGFACCEADSMETVEDAIKIADEKMYRNKMQLKKRG